MSATRRVGVALILFIASGVAARADELGDRITALADAHKGKVAVAVRHLRTGEGFTLHADRVMPTASLIKLPVMVEVYAQAAEGKVTLADMLTLRAADKVPGSGILTPHFSDGATFPLRDAVRLMIAFSDNTATNLVLDRIGLPSTNARMEKLGLKNTRVHAKVFKGSTTSLDPERTKAYGLGSTTAREMVDLLALIEAGKAASPEACQEMIAHLKACEDKDAFRRLLPAGAGLAHKTGAVTQARTAAGLLLDLPSGPVALCVLTSENEDTRWAPENAGSVLLAKVAKEVHDHFKAKAPLLDRAKLDRIDAAAEAAVQRGDCPGAVVLVVHRDEVVYRKAFGQRAVTPEKEPMTADTVFDLASLTKPLATAASILQLAERGRLKLEDPVAKHWPAFAANGKADVTIEQCLLHTSGLTPDNALADYRDGRLKALERVAGLKLEAPPGTRFRYSDVGFIVLGEIVERAGGKPLDRFAAENLFTPLKMADTGYAPGERLKPRVAPTSRRGADVIRGAVHDPRAFELGGVAGHAGLFGTADDLGRYGRMLLRGGELDGARVMTPETAALLTAPVKVPAGAGKPADRPLLRSRGWDVDTPFSAPRGKGFPPGSGFGHTGFTGTSVWVDPPSRTVVVVLTSRVHPNDKGNVTELRRQVATLAAEAVSRSPPD